MRPSLRTTLASLLGLVLAIVQLAPARAQGQEPPPDAVATFATDTVALGVGYSWGRGRLTFRGHAYNFTVSGVTLMGVGADRVEGVAEIRHLRSVKDFEGVYGLVGAGGAFINLSGAAAVLRNAKGVEIRLRAQGQGFSLGVGAGGATVKLGKTP